MATTISDVTSVLQSIQRDQELAILKLRSAIASEAIDDAGKRSSDVSATSAQNATPASLEADLVHYKVSRP